MKRFFSEKNNILVLTAVFFVLFAVVFSLFITISGTVDEYTDNTFFSHPGDESQCENLENLSADTPISEINENGFFVLFVDGKAVCKGKSEDEIINYLEKIKKAETADKYENISEITVKNSVLIVPSDGFDVMLVSEKPEIKLSLSVSVIEEVKESVSYQTVFMDDTSLEEGKKSVYQSGKNGESSYKYKIVYENGEIVSKELLETNVITASRNEIIKVGVKTDNSDSYPEYPMFIMPYNGGITSEYGERILLGGTYHYGLDIASTVPGHSVEGEKFVAAGDGKVIFAGSMGDFGNSTIIEHENGIRTYYCHQKKILVSVGDYVKQGQVIGQIGHTGLANGPHLHFEVRLPDLNGDYKRVDPKYYIIDYESYYR